MAEPTITQIFGTGATRLASGATTPSAGLFIPDSALQAGGLTNPSTSTAEGHFSAINLNAKTYLTQANFDANIDQSIYIGTGYSGFTNRGTDNTQYRTDQLTITLAKVDNQSNFNPDDY